MNLLVSFDLIFLHSAKPYFCLMRLEKAQGKAIKTGWFRANVRGKDLVCVLRMEVVVQAAGQGMDISKTPALLDTIRTKPAQAFLLCLWSTFSYFPGGR